MKNQIPFIEQLRQRGFLYTSGRVTLLTPPPAFGRCLGFCNLYDKLHQHEILCQKTMFTLNAAYF